MSTVDPERKPDIFGPLSTPELLHNRLMNIFEVAQREHSSLLEVGDNLLEPTSSDVQMRLYATGRDETGEIFFLGTDNKLKYIEAEVYLYDEYDDTSGLGRDADGEPSQIMRVDPMAELTHRSIEVTFNVKDHPGPIHGPEGVMVGHQNGWEITYDVDDGWDLRFFWRAVSSRSVLEPKIWVEPTKEQVEYLPKIIEHAARKVSGNA